MASSTGTPAVMSDGFSSSKVNDRGSGTTSSRLRKYTSVNG
jgi:hypothetical protein